MGDHTELKVKLDKFQQVFGVLGEGNAATQFAETLRATGITGNEVSFYQENTESGGIVFRLSSNDYDHISIRFSPYGQCGNGDVSERLDRVATLMTSAFFTTGLLSQEDTMLATGLAEISGCYLVGGGQCPPNAAESVKAKIEAYKQETTRIKKEVGIMPMYLRDMVNWAAGEDHWYNGIKPAEITEVIDSYRGQLRAAKTDAEKHKIYLAALRSALMTFTGAQYALEKKYMSENVTKIRTGLPCERGGAFVTEYVSDGKGHRHREQYFQPRDGVEINTHIERKTRFPSLSVAIETSDNESHCRG